MTDKFPSKNLFISIISEWWCWILLIIAGMLIFMIRTWNLHFLLKIGVIALFALIMTINLAHKGEYKEVLSDEDVEEQFLQQNKPESLSKNK